jgi:hypothetical protein
MAAVVMLFTLKLMFIKDVQIGDSVTIVHFEGGQVGRLVNDNKEDYENGLHWIRDAQNNRRPVAVSMTKANKIVELTRAERCGVEKVMDFDAKRLRIGFRGPAGVYYLSKDNPDFERVHGVLQQAVKDGLEVWFSVARRLPGMLIVDVLKVKEPKR